jgi:hypothetical protein
VKKSIQRGKIHDGKNYEKGIEGIKGT